MEQTMPTLEQLVSAFHSIVDWSSGDAETLHRMYQSDGGELDEDTLWPANENDFNGWMKRHVEFEASELEHRFDRIMRQNGGFLPIWREITAPRDWNPAAMPLGIYWSFEADAAEAHWGSHGPNDVKWVMESRAAANQVQWLPTIVFNIDGSSYDSEKEIRLIEGTKISIVRAWQNKQPVKIPPGPYLV